MTLKEAIKTLRRWENPEWIKHHKQAYEAIQLGIEALKVIREVRVGCYDAIHAMLPGETEE